MTEKEKSECKATAVALKGISLLGLIVFITIPTVLMASKHYLLLENSLILSFLISGLFIGFRAWHLQFDAKLLEEVADKSLDLNDLDSVIFKLFGKKMESKSLQERMISCQKLAKGFLLLLKIHLVFYVLLMVFLLFF